MKYSHFLICCQAAARELVAPILEDIIKSGKVPTNHPKWSSCIEQFTESISESEPDMFVSEEEVRFDLLCFYCDVAMMCDATRCYAML